MARLETLFRRYRDRGSARALGTLFDRTADETLRVAMHFARDPAQAEEWLQQTYLIAIERAETWDDTRPFMPWLLGILRNVVRRAHGERVQTSLPDAPLTASVGRDPVEDLEWTTAVAEAVETLADPYRGVLILRLQHGLEPAEIARLQRVPPATIRSQIHRGLRHLRAALPPDRQPQTLATLAVPIGLAAIRTNVLTAASLAAPAAVSTTAVATTSLLGGLLVQKTVLISLAVAALVFAIIDPLGFWIDEVEPPSVQDTATGATGDADAPELRVADKPPPTQPRLLVGPDIDLATVDRRNDLHGIVERTNGKPIAGAQVRFEEVPWRGQMVLNMFTPEVIERGTTTTGPRGTFVMPLQEGVRGRLVVTAPGHAARSVWLAAAGERVRVVLDAAVSLLVRVKAPDGSPAAGVPVHVSGAGAGIPRAPAHRTTDTQGEARIEGLDPGGDLMVWAAPTHPGWGQSSFTKVTLPTQGLLEHAIELPTGRTVRGIVTDAATGEPIPGARVGIRFNLNPSVETNESGAYVLHGWTGDGAREIASHASGYVLQRHTVGDATTLDFALVVGTKLSGRITDASGTPIERARVAVVGSVHEGRVQRLTLAHGWTGADGRFAVDGLASDMPLSVQVRATGHARRIVDIDAVEAATHDVGDIVLREPLTLSGMVLNSDGTPTVRMPVRLHGFNADRAERRKDKEPAHLYYGTREDVITDDLGRFVVTDLCAAEYEITVKRLAPLAQMTVTLDGTEPRTEVTLQLPTTRTLRVRVLRPDGSPQTQGSVRAHHERRFINGRLDAQGWTELVLPGAVKTVQVLPFNRAERDEFVDLGDIPVPKGTDELVIRQRRAELIRGVVLQPDGAPFKYALVRGTANGSVKHHVVTDEAGRFTMKSTDPSVDISVGGESHHNGQQSFLAFIGEKKGVPPGTQDVRIQTVSLRGDASLSVRVLGPDGPLEGLAVFLLPGEQPTGLKKTDADGRVLFEGLGAVERMVKVFGNSSDGAQWSEKRVKATPGESEVTITLARPGLLHGVILGPDGKPVARAMLMLKLPDEDERILSGGQTPPDGKFTFAVMPGSRLRLSATAMIDRKLMSAEIVFDDLPKHSVELRLKPDAAKR